MRKLILGILMLLPAAGILAQSAAPKNQFKKGKVFGVHFTFHDFQTASEIKSIGLAAVLPQNNWYKTSRLSPGLALSHTEGLSDHIDIMARVGGSILSYPVPERSSTRDKLLLEADVNLNIKLLTDKYFVTPYLSVGAGGSTWGGYASAYLPLGAGVQINMSNQSFIFLQSQYRAPVTTNNGASHLFWGVGFAGNIGN